MVLVPGGLAWLGDPWENRRVELGELRLQHVDPFLIAKCEVTNEEYLEFLRSSSFLELIEESRAELSPFAQAAARTPLHPTSWEGGEPRNKLRHPVTGVSAIEAHAYASWKDAALPSSDQWEKAARGPAGRTYPWGDGYGQVERVALAGLFEVGRRELDRSPYGLYDVVANASEWTHTIEWVLSQSPLDWLARGDSHAESGMISEARLSYERAAELSTGSSRNQIYARLGRIYAGLPPPRRGHQRLGQRSSPPARSRSGISGWSKRSTCGVDTRPAGARRGSRASSCRSAVR